ncbi:IclR family transcriptional regulator C-terminal domain-containing protein [Streptomyces sp. NPDC089919]|uniref:IclR family transcriptional regulator domain-containing protein n=1 Tax=Streptomyces sp. NPDC089919 TaxID=3155188 RepID=UPI003430189D
MRAPGLTHDAQQVPAAGPEPTALVSVHRALRVLEVVHRFSGGVSQVQIARQTGLSSLLLATVLGQLVRADLVTPLGPDAYVAGSALRLTGAVAGTGMGQLQDTLAWVRDAVGAAVYVSRYTDGEITITQYADGPAAPVVEEWVDFREAGHASAVGKALLTQLDYDSRMDHLTRHRIARLTAHTITNERVLFHQLDDRMPGEALLDLQEYRLGTVCAAVPITSGPNAECVALSLPAPDPERLRQAARTLQSEAATVLLALLVTGSAPTAPAGAAAGPREHERIVLSGTGRG